MKLKQAFSTAAFHVCQNASDGMDVRLTLSTPAKVGAEDIY